MDAREIILTSSKLRARDQYREAIDIIDANFSSIPEAYILNAVLAKFYAARDGGLTAEATAYAKELLKIEPGLPSARRYLGI